MRVWGSIFSGKVGVWGSIFIGKVGLWGSIFSGTVGPVPSKAVYRANSSKIGSLHYNESINRKIKIGKIGNLIFLSMQHIPHLFCIFYHLKKNGF